MVLISVAGAAATAVPPERGTVVLRLTADGQDAAATVAALHERIAGEARAFADSGAATRWSAGPVVTAVESRWAGREEREERVLVATAIVEVRFRDLAALAAWTAEAVAVEGVLLDRVDWDLTRAVRRECERAVRAAAVRDAQVRAADYAAELGAAEVRLVQLWEAGLRPAVRSGWQAQARAMGGSAEGRPALHPADIEVEAAVAADFETAGDLPSITVREGIAVREGLTVRAGG